MRGTTNAFRSLRGAFSALAGGLAILAFAPATAATLRPGDIIVVSGASARVIQVDPRTGSQSLITSGGMLGRPVAVAIEASGSILVVDGDRFGPHGPQIIRVDPVTGGQSIVSAGGILLDPHDIAIDSGGDLLIADFSAPAGLGGILRVDAETGAQSVVFDSPSPEFTPLSLTIAAGGEIFYTRTLGFFGTPLFRLDPGAGSPTLVASDVGSGQDIVIEASGEVLVADGGTASGPSRVLRVEPRTGAVAVVSAAGLFRFLRGIAASAEGLILVTDEAGTIMRVDPVTGAQAFVSSGGIMDRPDGIAIVDCRFHFNPDRADGDGDGIGDFCDNCPVAPNPDQADSDSNGVGDACALCPPFQDNDGDDVCNGADNCPMARNPDQVDGDGDGFGDACDFCGGPGQSDSDGDGLCDEADNCRFHFNPDQADGDGDGIGDVCDNCSEVPNSDQSNADGDVRGDACDGDHWYVAPGGLDTHDCLSPDTACASLGAAIGKATTGDAIFVAIGTYTGTGEQVARLDRNLTLSGGWDATFAAQMGQSVLDGEATRRGLTVASGITATVERFVARNGRASGFGGGGVLNQDDAALTLSDCLVEGNSSFGTGAIRNLRNGNITLNRTTVRDNLDGAGIDNSFQGTMVLNQCIVTGNARSGIVNWSTLTLNSSLVSGNQAFGIDNDAGTVSLRGTTVEFNKGGISNFTGVLMVDGSTIRDNGYFSIGGIRNTSGNGRVGKTTIVNSTISGNSTNGSGGGVYNSGALVVKNSTITENSAAVEGGGIYLQSNPGFASLNLQNSVLAGNSVTGFGQGPDCAGDSQAYPSGGYNLLGSLQGCPIAPAANDLLSIDPLLGPLQDNGGPTLTHALLACSPAIDAGDPAGCSDQDGNLLASDQRGIARPIDGDGDGAPRCDIGAFEAASPQDGDGDGVDDACDNCPTLPNPDQADLDFNGVGDACALCPPFQDNDGDSVCNDADNCRFTRNSDQADGDGDGFGDACDSCNGPGPSDSDGDGLCSLADNCPLHSNADQADGDGEGIGDACDNCSGVPNPDQADSDFNGVGDACALCSPYQDSDGDNVCNGVDICLSTPNPDQADGDGDGIGDACDNCPVVPNPDQADSDHNGVGDACALCLPFQDSDGDNACNDADICPSHFNPDQVDGDGDGIGDACDNCLVVPNPDQADSDFNGAGDACALCPLFQDNDGDNVCNDADNCLFTRNPDQADSDGDGFGNACDSCSGEGQSDSDGDGVCDEADNCRFHFNPDQADGDGDGTGQACDNCLMVPNPDQADSDFNGVGDACALCPPFQDYDGDNICNSVDTCLFTPNPDQADGDRDGTGDACDNCLFVPNPDQEDSDFDGVGDACAPCPPFQDADGDLVCNAVDNCLMARNPDQADADGDGMGDVCDSCPLDPAGDPDGDGACASIDNCPAVPNNQMDADADSVGDACDNCVAAANPGQSDSDLDGSGDACQPTLALSSIRQGGAATLIVTVEATDPQNDPLSGVLELFTTATQSITLPDALATNDCGAGYFPEGVPGEGIGFANGSVGVPFLFDLDAYLGCGDFYPDYLLALGTCDNPQGSFDTLLNVASVTAPAAVCVRRYGTAEGGIDLTILSFDSSVLQASWLRITSILGVPFDSWLPGPVDISGLQSGQSYRLLITVTDGTTLPVTEEGTFVYQGETRVVFRAPNSPPVAVIAAPSVVECSGPSGAMVTLDAAGSADPDSTPGTADDILSFVWIEDAGLPGERILGSGMTLDVTLPLGPHAIGLRATDSQGAVGAADTVVTVRDTTAPSLTLTASPTTLWPPNHRLVQVQATWQVSDACDTSAAVALASVTSSEPDDAPGSGDGSTSQDIQDDAAGSADTSVLLRAERTGGGPVRFYTLTYAATDASGNTASALGIVTVPHDLGTGPEPLIMGLEPNGMAGTAHLYWNAVPGAEMYDLIQGDLGRVTAHDGTLWLGPVNVLASGITGTSHTEESADVLPPAGRAYFYLAQYRQAKSVSGWGTESSQWPAEPTSCDRGCPGAIEGGSSGAETPKRK